MSQNPPAYVAEIEKQLKSLSTKDKNAALVAMTDKAKSDETQKTLAEEVKGLTGVAIEIDNAFEDIRVKLTKAELQAARDAWKGAEPLVDGWVKLQKQFRELLLRSRKSASDIVYYIDRFHKVVLGVMADPAATNETKQKVIKTFSEKKIPYNGREVHLKDFEDGWDYANEFQNLARDVKLYAAKFLDVGDKQKKAWKDQSQKLDEDIAQLTLDLDAIHKRIVTWAAVCGVGVAVAAGSGVLFALGPLGPIAAGAIALVGLIAAGVASGYLDKALSERKQKETEKKTKEDELAQIKEKEVALAAVQLAMAEAVRKADGIVSRLGAFKVIWNAIANEARKLLNQIDDTTNTEDLDDYTFGKDVEFTKAGLAVLKVALENYAQLIADTGLKELD